MPVTSAEGLPAPTPGDATAVPADMQALTAALGPRTIPPYASTAARDAAIGSSGATARTAIVGQDLWMRRNGSWQVISLLQHSHTGAPLLGTAQAGHRSYDITVYTGTAIGNVAGQPSRWFFTNPFSNCIYHVSIRTVQPQVDCVFEFHRAESSMSSLCFWARNRAGALITSGGSEVQIMIKGA